jgi:hypothetical protein
MELVLKPYTYIAEAGGQTYHVTAVTESEVTVWVVAERRFLDNAGSIYWASLESAKVAATAHCALAQLAAKAVL